MGNKGSKEKAESNRVSTKVQKGPLPNIPCADEVIIRERRKEKQTHDPDIVTAHSNDELAANVYLVLYDFGAFGHNTVTVYKNEKVELRSQVKIWSHVYVPRLKKSGWIPSNYLAPLNSLSRYPWYHKQITRSKAEWLLRNGINGSFLVRESESARGQYSLSVRHEGKKYHYRIQSHAGRVWINEETPFKDLAELIHHHSLNSSGLVTTLTHPVPNESKPVIDNLTDEWEIDRDAITLGEKLGCGQYGEVYKGEWFRDRGKSAGIPIAVKTLKSDSASQEEFLKEASLMKRLKHENLLHLLGVCTLQKPFFIITEYMPLGNLLEYIRNNKEQMTSEHLLHAASQIAAGMCFLETVNMVHRDLACRNCLVGESMTIRICDFGLSRLLDEDSYTAREGTKFPIKWTAPEALNYNTFTMKSDVWSFGVVLWELATEGESPYPSIDLQEVLGLLETGYRMKRPDGCPEQVYKLMEECWLWEPEKRPTFEQITLNLENMFTSSSVEEEVQRTLEEDTTPTGAGPSALGAGPSALGAGPATRPISPNRAVRSDRSKSAPVDPAKVSTPDKRTSYRGLTPEGKQLSFDAARSSPKLSQMRQPVPPQRNKAPASLRYNNNIGQYPAVGHEQAAQFYNPHYPSYPSPYHPNSSKRHHLTQQQLQQLQQQQLSQQQHQIQHQMQQIKFQQQQQQQRLAQKQQQELWLRQQQQIAQNQQAAVRPGCDKNRSNSECSSNSASSTSQQDRTPGNGSPGTGNELLSELKFRQSRRGPKTEDSNRSIDSTSSQSPKPHPKIPQKPTNLRPAHTNGGTSSPLNFCAVNPTKPASDKSEDFSFETVLQRAKGIEKKGTLPKPIPPPKPKINLT